MCQIFHVTINIYLTHIFFSHMLSDRFFAWFGKDYLLLNQSAVQSVTYLGSYPVRHTVTQFVNQPISQSDRFSDTLCEKCWNSEFFWSVFSSFGLNTEIWSISPYSVRLREKLRIRTLSMQSKSLSTQLSINAVLLDVYLMFS